MIEINKIYNMDCLEGMKLIDDNSIDSIVTDPPYELGFMNKKWDNTGISYNINIWKECLRVLKPGGYLLSFGGTRTYHRMACAIEDAGFQIRDEISNFYDLEEDLILFIESLNKEQKRSFNKLIDQGSFSGVINYLYGSGFPKSMDISKQIDKMMGVKREIVGKKQVSKDYTRNGLKGDMLVLGNAKSIEIDITESATPEAKQWEGFGTALKPAHEPIVMARKPLEEKTVVDNVLKWNTGGINIDDCRIEFSQNDDPRIGKNYSHNAKAGLEIGNNKDNANGKNILLHKSGGRWPANIILDEEAGRLLDKQSGILKSGGTRPDGKNNSEKSWKNTSKQIIANNFISSSQGGASRYFYCSKTSKKEKGDFNNHPTVKPLKLIEYLVRLVTPPEGIVLDPFMGSGTTAIACINEGFNYIGFELESNYCEIANKRIKMNGINIK